MAGSSWSRTYTADEPVDLLLSLKDGAKLYASLLEEVESDGTTWLKHVYQALSRKESRD